MANAPPIQKLPPEALWPRLAGLELFASFTAEQREAFLLACEHDPALGLRRFPAGAVLCRKGEYELDLCFILSGRVEVSDQFAGAGRVVLRQLGTGQVYGELGALGGVPRAFDVSALESVEIFYVPRHALKLIEVNPDARAQLAASYRDKAVRATAAELPLLRDLPESAVGELVLRCEIQRYEMRGLPLVTQGEPGDAFYIVRDGFVQVVREQGEGGRRVLAYLRAGEFFGEMALFETGVRWASVLTAGKCELIKIKRDDFLALCRAYPLIEQRARAIIATRHEQAARITPEVSALLEKSGQLGMIQADALLVIDLDKCVGCDNCVNACESLHGKSRLIRNGIQLGKYLIPGACRHCDDPKCMNSCPTGAIQRRPEGEIYFQYDLCIGCGNCAIACPFDNIAMIDTPTFDRAQAHKARIMGGRDFFRPYPVAAHDVGEPGLWERLFGTARAKGKQARKPVTLPASAAVTAAAHVPAAFPIKCDLCDGLPFMGCVHNCPTGAAIRIDPAELFEDTGAVSQGSRIRKVHGGND